MYKEKVRTMSESPNGRIMTADFESSESDECQTRAQARKSARRAESGIVPVAVLEKIQEFFQICDSEGKGFITSNDMKKLHGELPLTSEDLQNVFDSLDLDKNGCLTLEEFSSGFSDFMYGSQALDQAANLAQNVPELLNQDESRARNEAVDARRFSLLMEHLGANSVFKDEARSLWAQLQTDEPHLLPNFEEFLARVTSQIKQERKEMENALRMKDATHDGEIQQLYEEMEQQINTEKDRLFLKDSGRLQGLEQQLSSREQELQQLCLRHRRLEQQCQEFYSEHQESREENIKLKLTNEKLSRELENTRHKLSLAQERLTNLEEQAVRLQKEKEMEIYRITEGLQREKESLIKQLDLLREMNKHLRDERDISSMQSNSLNKITDEQSPTLKNTLKDSKKKHAAGRETSPEEVTQPFSRKPSSLMNGRSLTVGDTTDGKTGIAKSPQEVWPLHRIISIEEDHLPNLLRGDPHLLLHQLTEEEEGGGQEEARVDLEMCSSDMSLASVDSSPLAQGKMCLSAQKGEEGFVSSMTRGQPVGKGPVEGVEGLPTCIFKVIFVGNSNVGKTALLRRFCDGQFHPTTATVGLDYCVRALNLGDSHVTLQLWDTAGQERYRSITQQFFRKADGVVVIYDITARDSFTSVRSWLASILDAVGGHIPIMLLGNKSDRENLREVVTKAGERLAEESCLMFYECSAFTGHNVLEAMLHLARVMREQEDRVCESTVLLVDKPMKKKACCN